MTWRRRRDVIRLLTLGRRVHVVSCPLCAALVLADALDHHMRTHSPEGTL